MFIKKAKTVVRYCRKSWHNSAFLLTQSKKHSRIWFFFDLVFCFVFYGDDFTDYCEFEFWNKTAKEREKYISCRRNDYLRFSLSTPDAYKIFLDKEAFNCHFSKYIHRKWLSTQGHTIDEIISFVNTHKSLIVKPIDSFGGEGIFKIDRDSDTFESQLNKLISLIQSDRFFILEELLSNCAELHSINPSSLNTLRIVTVIDNCMNLHILASVLRVGNGCCLTDNYSSGGMACAVDLQTGRLKGVAHGDYCSHFPIHPYSNIRFDGFLIPGFFDCIEMVKELAFVVPQARYVGWDLALTNNGIELLEGNIPPGQDLTQIGTGYGVWHQLKEWI